MVFTSIAGMAVGVIVLTAVTFLVKPAVIFIGPPFVMVSTILPVVVSTRGVAGIAGVIPVTLQLIRT
jgi:hypothetical protein